MRGDDQQQDGMFSYISPDKRVPQDHPLRMIRSLVDGVLEQLSPRFNRLYARAGRPSIAPEKLLRALLLQMLYSVRSERLLMEQLDYNLLFRWFVGLSMDDEGEMQHVLQEPGAIAGRGYCGSFLSRRVGRSASRRTAERRTFYRGWDAAGGLGIAQELSAR